MKRMRFLTATLIVWLFLFYNIERVGASVDLTGAAYIFVPIVGTLPVLLPSLSRRPFWLPLTASTAAFLAFKLLGRQSWNSPTTLTVTELVCVWLTVVLAKGVGGAIGEFENAVEHISIGEVGPLPADFIRGREEMYRELKRARHHRRPLALMSIGLDENSVEVALDRVVREVQQAMMKQYVLAGIAGALGDTFEEYDIITRDNDHFLALLPEMTEEQLNLMVAQVRRTVSERLGIVPLIGTASFPGDAMTFDGLVAKAIENMHEQAGRGKEK